MDAVNPSTATQHACDRYIATCEYAIAVYQYCVGNDADSLEQLDLLLRTMKAASRLLNRELEGAESVKVYRHG